jgi:ribosomal protein L32
MDGVKITAGEFDEKETSKRSLQVVGDVVKEYLEKGESRKFICSAVDTAHVYELQRQFLAAGINCAAYTYKETEEDRDEILREYRKANSTIHGLITVTAASKGFDCISEGTLVLTQRGEVPIEDVLITDKVWDGVEFVSHRGAIFKGVRDVITYAGITATPDHQVFTSEGWESLGNVAQNGGAIAKTGDGSQTILISAAAFQGREGSVYEPESPVVSALRREGDSFFVQFDARSGTLGASGHWPPIEGDGAGQDKQPRELRAGESSLVESFPQQLAHKQAAKKPAVPSDTATPPGSSLCGQDTEESAFSGVECGANHCEVSSSIGQAQRRVWDILEAGPRNRFTAAGLLVHNCPDIGCVIMARPLRKSLAEHIQFFGRGLRIHEGKENCIVLDHSGNSARFWHEWNDFFENGLTELDDGKKKAKPKQKDEDQEKEMVKCPKCRVMHMPRPSCPACGHEYPRKAAIEHVPGTLKELIATGNSSMMRRELWPQVCSIVLETTQDPERAQRRAQAIYFELTGGFAKARVETTTPASPTPELRSKIKSNQIRFIKGKQAADRQGVPA